MRRPRLPNPCGSECPADESLREDATGRQPERTVATVRIGGLASVLVERLGLPD